MSDDRNHLRPICFMVMPFRRKKVEDPKGPDAPAELNCDALWDKALRPAIEQLGYLAIRADNDPGSVIVKDMLERLAFADLVLADVSLPNPNVYYEVGLRHVARNAACVLLAAAWSRQLFDIDQFRAVRYPLAGGEVSDADAEAIRALLVGAVPKLKDAKTPYYEFITGSEAELKQRGVFREFAQQLSDFQAKAREARLLAQGERRKEKVLALQGEFAGSSLLIPDVAIELLRLVRDECGWKETAAFIDSLPEATRSLPFIQEQYLLALASEGRPEEAIARLEELIQSHGDSPERQGLIGGRYKRLWREARREREGKGMPEPSLQEEQHLERAIEHYTRGMELDYNEYYCSSNIPPLLRARGAPGDAERARVLDQFVLAACRRALTRGVGDEWLRPTLLGAAFRAGDVGEAEKLARQIALEGGARWKLDATLSDLAESVRSTGDEGARRRLQAVYERLKALADQAGG
jgi:hypothetical protein